MSMRWLVPAAAAIARRLLSAMPSVRADSTTASSRRSFGVGAVMYHMVHLGHGIPGNRDRGRAARTGVSVVHRRGALARADAEHPFGPPSGRRSDPRGQRGDRQATGTAAGTLAGDGDGT